MQHTVYYFTGTGNSLSLAKNIAKECGNVVIQGIAPQWEQAKTLMPKGIVGFVFPIYYCGIPQIVRQFMKEVNLSATDYIYVVCTYGTFSGNAGGLSQSRSLLRDKEKELDAGFYVKMVDNFVLLTWDVPNDKRQKVNLQKAQQKSKQIADTIIKRQNHYDRSITEHIFPVLFGYRYFIKTVNTNDRAFFTTDKCVSCGLCSEVCPTQNIALQNGKPTWKSERCQRCLSCLHLCPAESVQYGIFTKHKTRYHNPDILIDELK
ncbi:MAG: EFR1 family ferrodoxin [Lachnospiraceae bacterium]